MEQHWWSSDWIKYFIGWIVGIPSGIVANWLYDKIKTWRRKETNYLNTSYSKGIMRFEGQYTNTNARNYFTCRARLQPCL